MVGLGYVGLTSAVCLASIGHRVIGLDISDVRVQALRDGVCPIHEDGLEGLLQQTVASGNLNFTTDATDLANAEAVILCLPTPEGPTGSPDVSILRAAVVTLRDVLKPGAVVVTKSTVPLGTADSMKSWIDRDDLRFVSNPEFLREGTAVHDYLHPDRVVVGSHDPAAASLIASLYAGLDTEIITCDPLSAEMIKYASNAFLATKLSFVNELARICDQLGGDIDAVTHGLGTDHRIAPTFLSPGPGWGGSCFPKDVAGLATLARASRLRVPLIESAGESNRDHLDHVIGRALDMLVGVTNPVVALWGLAFKANTDDVRASPAIELVERLRANDVDVRAHDPVATVDDAIVTQGEMVEVCVGADLVIVATEWEHYAVADLAPVANAMRRPVMFDLRDVIRPDAAEEAGLSLFRLGRRTHAVLPEVTVAP